MKLSLSMNPYFAGCLILLGLWAGTYVLLQLLHRVSEVREFWWGSFTCALLGVTKPLFVPEYWDPPSILKWGDWDVESYLFCFATGGIAAVLTELPAVSGFFKQMDYAVWRMLRGLVTLLPPRAMSEPSPRVPIVSQSVYIPAKEMPLENMVLVTFSCATFGMSANFTLNIIYKVAFVCFAVASFIAWRRPRLRWQVFGGSFTFTVLYGVVLFVTGTLYPTFYVDYWNLPALSGRWIGSAPAEEYLFAASLGSLWAPLYEAIRLQRDS